MKRAYHAWTSSARLFTLSVMKLRNLAPACAVQSALVGILFTLTTACSSRNADVDELASAAGAPAVGAGGQSGDEGRDTESARGPTSPAVGDQLGNPDIVYTNLDVEDFEFDGQPIAQLLASFGGTRTGNWLAPADESFLVLNHPEPGATSVSLTVTGEPISAREAVRAGYPKQYLIKVPLRLQVGETIDVSFEEEVVLEENGSASVAHVFPVSELGNAVDFDFNAVLWRVDGYSLYADLWPGGSVGALSVPLYSADGIAPAVLPASLRLLSDTAPPPPPPPPPPQVLGPPAGWPSPWASGDSGNALLAWPNGKGCAAAYHVGANSRPTGRNYAIDGLTPNAILEALSALEGLSVEHVDGTAVPTASNATRDAGASANAFTIEVLTTQEDICFSTLPWEGSTLDRLSITVDMHVTEATTGLDITLPVDVVAFHDGATISDVYFASDVENYRWTQTWTPEGVLPPAINASTFHDVTGLSTPVTADVVFPLLTGWIDLPDGAPQAKGQLLLAAPRVGDGDLTPPGESAPVTDLNLAQADTSEIQTLFWSIDYSGVDEIYYNGVWSNGADE